MDFKIQRILQQIWCKIKQIEVTKGIQSIIPGANVTVDNTDPLNPIVSSTGGGGIDDQENINRIPSATYSELGISPGSTLAQKQQAISDFLEGYNNGEKDVLFFEILDDEENQGLKIIDLTN